MISKVTYQRKYMLRNGEYEYLCAEATYSDTAPLTGDEMMAECRRICVEHSSEYLYIKRAKENNKVVAVEGEVSS